MRKRKRLTCSRTRGQPIAGGAPAGLDSHWLKGPIRRSPPVTTWLCGGREGDMGGSQGLVRVSLEALHTDID
jgi:hypothetical protein